MPTHAVMLHEWGIRGMGGFSCIGNPPRDKDGALVFD
jgi:hypothetical protein